MTRDDLYPRDENLRNILQEDCVACPLHLVRNQISWGYGQRPCRLMVLGEAPAEGDPNCQLWKGSNYTGMPFTNIDSGLPLRKLMYELGAELNRKAYVTNVVKCFPGHHVTKAGERKPNKPKPSHFDACWAHLSRELAMVQPELVVCVGGFQWDNFNRLMGRKQPQLTRCVMLPPVDAQVGGLRFRLMGMFHPARWESWVSVATPGMPAYIEHLRTAITSVL